MAGKNNNNKQSGNKNKQGGGSKNKNNQTEPLLQCYFFVQIGKQLVGRFTSCSGIAYELEMETYQEGGASGGPHFFPVSLVPQKLVLERGVLTSDEMVAWMRASQDGAFPKLDGVIELRDARGKAMQTWNIQEAYPVKYEGPSFNALTSEVAVTRIEIMYKGILPAK